MKRILLPITILLGACLGSSLHAVVYTNILADYHFGASFPVGTPLTNDLVGNWVQAGTNGLQPPVVAAGGLSYYGLANLSGNSVSFGGNGMCARCVFDAYQTLSQVVSNDGPLYFSFLVKFTNIDNTTSGGTLFAGFNNSSGSSTTTPTVVAPRVYVKTNSAGGGFLLGMQPNGGTIVWDTTPHDVNETLLIVGKYEIVNGLGGADDLCSLWINPSSALGSSSETPPTLGPVPGGDLPVAGIQSFVLLNKSAVPYGYFDELKVRTNWAGAGVQGLVPLASGKTPLSLSTVTSNNVTCHGANNGSIQVTAPGGATPLEFSDDGGANWTQGTSPYTFSSLAPGSYNIKVRDTNHTTFTYTNNPVVITQPSAAVAANAGSDKTVCAGGSVGIGGSPTGSGGTGLLSYLWSPATGLDSATAPNPMASPTSTTTYTVTVTDANNCTGSDSVLVTVNSCGGLASVTITNISGTTLDYTGGAGAHFVLLKSPGVTAPLSSWSREHTNNVTPGSFTIPAVGTGGDTVFYSIKSE